MASQKRFEEILARAKILIHDEVDSEGTRHLKPYLTRAGGSQFESSVDSAHPNSITEVDINALRYLSVNVRGKSKSRLLNVAVRERVSDLLSEIPIDLALEDLDQAEFSGRLGKGSKASDLWGVVYEQLKDAHVRDGRQVTAGKLLYAKRPKLLPIYDSQVRRSLGVTIANSWEAVWYIVSDPGVRDSLNRLKNGVPEAAECSLIRILDIVAWSDNGASYRASQSP
jgi:hypothetical protein